MNGNRKPGARLEPGVPSQDAGRESGVPDSPARGWSSRGYLPHLDGVGLIQHVVFHLADSLPPEVVERLERGWKEAPPIRREELRRESIEAWLDAGHGSCAMQEAALAKLVQDSLLSFHGDRYRLSAWVVMPNHVHVLVELLDKATLGKTVMSWKSFTGRRIRGWLDRGDVRLEPGVPTRKAKLEPDVPGEARVWHREYWDRYMRDEEQYRRTIAYIENNPVKAGLVQCASDWPWSSAHPDNAAYLRNERLP